MKEIYHVIALHSVIPTTATDILLCFTPVAEIIRIGWDGGKSHFWRCLLFL